MTTLKTERRGAMRSYFWRVACGSVRPALMIGMLGLGACDFSVVNPGPIPDDELDDPTGHLAVVNGTKRDLSDALDRLAYWTGALTFEINPAGSTGSFGIPPRIQTGTFDDGTIDGDWSRAQRARWTAEEAVRRFQRVLQPADFDKSILVAQAYLFAGYANRLLGENFCDAVFDGGAKEPHTAFFTRAEQHFTDANRVATAAGTAGTDVRTAAMAGRASVRASLATWNNNNLATWLLAANDAATVTTNTFVYQATYSEQDQDQYNYIVWANGNSPYRAHTQWGTYYEGYYQSTLDPRVRWLTTTLRGDAAVSLFGTNCTANACSVNQRVPWYPQDKFASYPATATRREARINLSSGWEMRLLRAEERLVNKDLPGAVGFMNTRRRALTPVQPDLNPATLADGWRDLKSERALELWLEARRYGDLRRWLAAVDSDEDAGTTFDGRYFLQGGVVTRTKDFSTQNKCFPIGRTETLTNPNLGS